MIRVKNARKVNFCSIPIDPFWNTGDEKELKMHRIHSYPAKFPAFITTKALDYAAKNGIRPNCIADVFCGCGTVAFEAKRNSINFWGCDINPVATMIAKAKSRKYKTNLVQKYFAEILESYSKSKYEKEVFEKANERLKYWYSKKQFEELSSLKNTIKSVLPQHSYYRYFFLCAFSNILKSTSRWLTKSIKPQIDPFKKPADVMSAFKEQCHFMITANEESDAVNPSLTKIITANFLDLSSEPPNVDMIITSPPYVTSYEYADLHQLSSLWLGHTEDYRDLREGSLGSLYNCYNFEKELKRLNNTGANIVFRLLDLDKAKARSVAKYYLDMQRVAEICHNMLSNNGIVLFVIGNTEYKGVRIENAQHLTESLLNSGFTKVHVTKRKISKKILTPYRNTQGQFTTDKTSRKVYSEEFILIGRN